MKRLILILSLVFAGFTASAQSRCGISLQGGPDTFPWSMAEQFLWSKIQGLWKDNSPNSDLVIKFKVLRESEEVKHLAVTVYSKSDCTQPLMSGIGIISSGEKNVVRVNLIDKSKSSKLMKLAFFNMNALVDNPDCSNQGNVLGASIIDLGDNATGTGGGLSKRDKDPEYSAVDESSMTLRKMTGSIDFFCRRKN